MGSSVETLTTELYFGMSFDTYGKNFECRPRQDIGSENPHQQVTKVWGRCTSGCSLETLGTEGDRISLQRQLCIL